MSVGSTHTAHHIQGLLSKRNGAQGCLFKQRTSPDELSAAIEQAIASVKLAEYGPRSATGTLCEEAVGIWVGAADQKKGPFSAMRR